jgi:mRNA interferase HigB
MHVISRKKLVAFWEGQRDAEGQLAAWFKVAKKAKWEKWADVQKAYPKASYYEWCLIFNICGGSYRLVVRRAENWKTLFIVGVYLHKEYDLDTWKASCRCR